MVLCCHFFIYTTASRSHKPSHAFLLFSLIFVFCWLTSICQRNHRSFGVHTMVALWSIRAISLFDYMTYFVHFDLLYRNFLVLLLLTDLSYNFRRTSTFSPFWTWTIAANAGSMRIISTMGNQRWLTFVLLSTVFTILRPAQIIHLWLSSYAIWILSNLASPPIPIYLPFTTWKPTYRASLKTPTPQIQGFLPCLPRWI